MHVAFLYPFECSRAEYFSPLCPNMSNDHGSRNTLNNPMCRGVDVDCYSLGHGHAYPYNSVIVESCMCESVLLPPTSPKANSRRMKQGCGSAMRGIHPIKLRGRPNR